MRVNLSPDRLNIAVSAVAAQVAMDRDEPQWEHFSEQQLWEELVGCILSSQVRHEACSAAHERLICLGLLEVSPDASHKRLGRRLQNALARPFNGIDNSFGFSGKYRFPNSKARQIARTSARLRRARTGLLTLLRGSGDVASVRRQLIATCDGVGPKQASLFLRNVGFSGDVAILDTHIIRYMSLMGLDIRMGSSGFSIQLYEEGECSFRQHALRCGFTTAVFDTAVWVVMRTLSSKGTKWQS